MPFSNHQDGFSLDVLFTSITTLAMTKAKVTNAANTDTRVSSSFPFAIFISLILPAAHKHRQLINDFAKRSGLNHLRGIHYA